MCIPSLCGEWSAEPGLGTAGWAREQGDRPVFNQKKCQWSVVTNLCDLLTIN